MRRISINSASYFNYCYFPVPGNVAKFNAAAAIQYITCDQFPENAHRIEVIKNNAIIAKLNIRGSDIIFLFRRF